MSKTCCMEGARQGVGRAIERSDLGLQVRKAVSELSRSSVGLTREVL